MKRFYLTLFALCVPSLVSAAGLVPCGDVDGGEPGCTFNHLLIAVQNIIDFAVKLSIPLAVLLFLTAGVLYLTAAGREAPITRAKGILQATVIGFVIVIAGWLIVRTVVNVFVPEDERDQYGQFLDDVNTQDNEQ